MVMKTAKSGALREKMEENHYDLVPFREITDSYKRVAEFGAVKYKPWNWAKGLARVQLIGSLLNHTFAYLRGQELDKDSGLNHTDHILWNAVALVHNVAHGLEDGRRVEPAKEIKKLPPEAFYPKLEPKTVAYNNIYEGDVPNSGRLCE
jgi:Domain of unknown function (DUF5664)